MNAFEFAMKMEMDGKTFYEEQAAKADLPELKNLLLELASDEQKHYNLFKGMAEGKVVTYPEAQKTKIVASIKNIFETLKAQNPDFEFPGDAGRAWEEAREVEKKSEAFYRQKAEETADDGQKLVWHRIADEERKHWQSIENVIQFLSHPKTWLADAEWHQLEDL
ncbi:MAG: ferritin family protein [bacterium]